MTTGWLRGTGWAGQVGHCTWQCAAPGADHGKCSAGGTSREPGSIWGGGAANTVCWKQPELSGQEQC